MRAIAVVAPKKLPFTMHEQLTDLLSALHDRQRIEVISTTSPEVARIADDLDIECVRPYGTREVSSFTNGTIVVWDGRSRKIRRIAEEEQNSGTLIKVLLGFQQLALPVDGDAPFPDEVAGVAEGA